MPWSGATIVPEVEPGQPADLLERRPDLLAAHARLEAANFRRRQAAAEWFPRLFVSALFGRQSLDVNDNDLGTARFTNASGLLTMPIFDCGRTRAINEIAESGQSEALLRYEDAIVRALEDVENTLVALRDERTRAKLLRGAAASAEAALGRAQSLYDRGQIDLLPLLDAQRTRLSVRVNANESNTKLRLDSVQLFKALGGGWQAFEPGAAPVGERRPPIRFPHPGLHQRGSVVKEYIGRGAGRRSDCSAAFRVCAAHASSRGRFGPFAPSSCFTSPRATRAATSARSRRGTKWIRRFASAARCSSAASTSARACVKATCSRCSTTSTTGSRRTRPVSSSMPRRRERAKPSRTGSACSRSRPTAR